MSINSNDNIFNEFSPCGVIIAMAIAKPLPNPAIIPPKICAIGIYSIGTFEIKNKIEYPSKDAKVAKLNHVRGDRDPKFEEV